MIITVLHDLALAVVVGVIVSALIYAWKSAHHIWVSEKADPKGDHVIYKLHGVLFFGSVTEFKNLFDPKKEKKKKIVIDFADSRVWDHSAIEAIEAVALKYKEAGKKLHLIHLSPDCELLLNKAKDMLRTNKIEDPHYGIVADYATVIKNA